MSRPNTVTATVERRELVSLLLLLAGARPDDYPDAPGVERVEAARALLALNLALDPDCRSVPYRMKLPRWACAELVADTLRAPAPASTTPARAPRAARPVQPASRRRRPSPPRSPLDRRKLKRLASNLAKRRERQAGAARHELSTTERANGGRARAKSSGRRGNGQFRSSSQLPGGADAETSAD